MDLLGYAALGGLERIAIIAGALVVGYWGYRLYAREQSAGLLFMGLACLVLVGALLTSGRHVRAVGESVQLARGTSPAADAARASESEASERGAEDSAAGSNAAAPPASPPPAPGAEAAAATPGDASTTAADSAPGSTPDAVSASVDGVPPAAPAAGETEDRSEARAATAPADGQRGLASAQELGGRIVSVKSANVTLEWTEAPARSR